MNCSDYINIILCILSFFLAVISVVTVVLTLKQNQKMIENSTRPYVVATGQVTFFQDPAFYLVLKNYGNSGAKIINFDCSIDLSKYSYSNTVTPFANINNTFIAPKQSIVCTLDNRKMARDNVNVFQVEICYSNSIDIYKDICTVNFSAYADNVHTRAATEGKELKIISYTLQDLVEKHF